MKILPVSFKAHCVFSACHKTIKCLQKMCNFILLLKVLNALSAPEVKGRAWGSEKDGSGP